MKTYIILLALLITSCRTGRHFERSGTNTLSEIQHKSSSYTWRQLDSNNRYWLYWGDSSFYYHPDKGLFANKGSLWVEEIQLKNSFIQSGDSSLVHNDQHQSSKTTVSKQYKKHWIGWIVIAIALLLYCRYRKN